MQYKIVHIHVPNPNFSEIIISELTLINYDSFEETEQGIEAYIIEENYDEEALLVIINKYTTKTEIKWLGTTILENKNWNKLWESNFEPIFIENKIAVIAPFHTINTKNYNYIIHIEPKMAFGTGHHETTYLMLTQLLNINCKQKTVLDFGCGTGILGIFAALKGAQNVTCIDNDPVCVDSTIENSEKNAVTTNAFLGDAKSLISLSNKYDIVLANINRNVLLDSAEILKQTLNKEGFLLLSGFYETDINDLKAQFASANLKNLFQDVKNKWALLMFKQI